MFTPGCGCGCGAAVAIRSENAPRPPSPNAEFRVVPSAGRDGLPMRALYQFISGAAAANWSLKLGPMAPSISSPVFSPPDLLIRSSSISLASSAWGDGPLVLFDLPLEPPPKSLPATFLIIPPINPPAKSNGRSKTKESSPNPIMLLIIKERRKVSSFGNYQSFYAGAMPLDSLTGFLSLTRAGMVLGTVCFEASSRAEGLAAPPAISLAHPGLRRLSSMTPVCWLFRRPCIMRRPWTTSVFGGFCFWELCTWVDIC